MINQFITTEECVWCRGVFPKINGITHEYIESVPGCWQTYSEILGKEYGEYGYPETTHRLTVDTYAIQHPGKPSHKSTQSVIVHLISLYFVLEKGLEGKQATQKIQKALQSNLHMEWLEPPQLENTITVLYVNDAVGKEEHEKRVREWALSVWEKWYSLYKDKINNWVQSF